MDSVGRILIIVGLGIAAVGGLAMILARLAPNFRPGRLPGDIAVQRDGFQMYLPLTTMLLASVLLSLILWIVQAWRR